LDVVLLVWMVYREVSCSKSPSKRMCQV